MAAGNENAIQISRTIPTLKSVLIPLSVTVILVYITDVVIDSVIDADTNG